MASLRSWIRRWFGRPQTSVRVPVVVPARRVVVRRSLRLDRLEDRSVPSAANVAPTLTNFAVTAVLDEGGTAVATGTISDPDVGDTFTLVLNWGDDGASQTVNLAAGTTTFSIQH